MKLASLLLVAVCASAQAESPVESALRNYGVVVAGTYLGMHCKWLPDLQEAEAMGNIEVLTKALSVELKSTDVVLMSHNAAINFAQKENFHSCGDEAKKLASAGIEYGRAWGNQVRAAYRPPQQAPTTTSTTSATTESK